MALRSGKVPSRGRLATVRQPLARAEFTILRLRLIKVGARIAETASRVRVVFVAAHPEARLFASLARCLQPAGP
jgi:hypothetical protein